MIWLVKDETSHQIISCNIYKPTDGQYELWVTRPNSKSLKIHESTNKEEVMEIKEAIDFAIEHKEPVLRLT